MFKFMYVVPHFGAEIGVRIGATDGIERFYLSASTSFHLSHVTEEYLTFVVTWMPWLFRYVFLAWERAMVPGTWAEGRLRPSLAEARWPSAVGRRGSRGGG